MSMELLKYAVFLATICASLTSAATCTLKTNADPTRCGIRGTVSPTALAVIAPISISKQSSKESCANLCARRINEQQTGYVDRNDPPYRPNYQCNSFFYDTKAGVCQLLGQNLGYASLDRNATQSSKIFYQADCFDCGDKCDQPIYTPLLDNGDFEDATFGPWAVQYSRRAPGRNSSSAYQCVGEYGYGSSYCYLGQAYNDCPGSLYMVRFDYLASGRYSLNQLTDGSLVTSNVSAADVGKWRTGWYFQTQFSPYYYGAVGLLQFQFEKIKNVTDERGFKVDNVYVSRIPNPPPIIKGTPNLLVNPGFESGKFKPWTKSGDANITAPGLGGSKHGVKCNGCTISQTIATAAGKAYLLQFSNRSPKKGFVSLQFTFNTKYSEVSYASLIAPEYNTSSIPFVADGPTTTIEIKYGEGILDNFSAKEINIKM